MRLSEKARKRVRSIGEERKNKRLEIFASAKEATEIRMRQSPNHIMGRSENGGPVHTVSPACFGISIDKWYVRLGFKRDDAEAFSLRKWTEAEAALKEGDVPKKQVTFDTHIITAVRALKHIRASYLHEQEASLGILQKLDRLNIVLDSKTTGYTDADIDEAMSCLEAVKTDICHKSSLLKGIVAVGRIDESLAKLKNAKEQASTEGNTRDFEMSQACAMLVSVRNRLGSWRDTQVAGIMDFNHRKECSLRPERDLWIYAQLKRYESDIDAMRQYLEQDRERAVVIYAIRMMLLDGEKNSKILDVLEKYNPIFRIEERRRLSPYERTSFHDTGVVPGNEGNVDYLMANYEQLYLAMKRGDYDEVHAYLHHLKLFIRANKPDFIFEELTGSADPYMAEVTETIGKGASFIWDGNTVQARSAFAEARRLFGSIVGSEPSLVSHHDS